VAEPRLIDRLDYTALPPGRHQLRYAAPSTTLPDGSPLTIAVTVLVGRAPRPRLAAIAGVHGNEYPGPLALLDLAQTLDPASIAGTLVLVPFANPLAYNAGARVTPEDGVNLNRVFPGDPHGTLTNRVAYALVDGIIQDADLAVDLHSADATGVMLPMTGFREPPPAADAHARSVALASARAAAAFGLEMDWMMRWAPGTLSTALNQRGIPAVGCEAGGGGIASPEEVVLYRDGVLRLVRGETRPLPPTVEAMEDLTAPASGLLDVRVALRQELRAGDLVARVLDPWGSAIAEVTAPFDGRVVHQRLFRQVRAGETVVSLGRRFPHPLAG
jgi:predicted deacylase